MGPPCPIHEFLVGSVQNIRKALVLFLLLELHYPLGGPKAVGWLDALVVKDVLECL